MDYSSQDEPYYSSSIRPVQVELCLQAAQSGDLEGVKKQTEQLLYSNDVSLRRLKPLPSWLYYSLSTSIERNDRDVVEYLLDHNVHHGDFPAETAVRAKAFDILKLFLGRGWDINQPNRDEPPILWIALSGPPDEEMAWWLLDNGADPNCACDLDLTPMSFAIRKAPLPMINILFERGANIQRGQLLHHAVLREEHDALELVTKLVEAGAPINEVKYENDPNSYWKRCCFGLGTPLHRAAELNKIDIVQYLLSKGATPSKLDSKRFTPRDWAEKCGNTEVAAILRAAEDSLVLTQVSI